MKLARYLNEQIAQMVAESSERLVGPATLQQLVKTNGLRFLGLPSLS
ncbi:hypothetical protein [Limnohabitans sp. MMS-10A-178]|jgi:hypothetical protein|nr:hypothetical protein [Limnohabitans sp. MMS-10A-178]